MGDAAKLAFAKMLFKRIYSRDRGRKAADAGYLATVNVLGWLQVLLLEVSREIEKRHVLLGERTPPSRIDLR
jgi:hypothetical protein